MDQLPEDKRQRKRHKTVTWLSALLGLVLLNLAADRFAFNQSLTTGWATLIAGLALIAFALWRAGKRN